MAETPQQKKARLIAAATAALTAKTQGVVINAEASKDDLDGKGVYKGRSDERTPTGANPSSPFKNNDELEAAYKAKGIDYKNMTDKEAQTALYKSADPFQKAFMWGAIGNTKKGLSSKQDSTFDKWKLKNPHESFKDFKARMISAGHTPESLNKELDLYGESFADGYRGLREAALLRTPSEEVVQPTTPVADVAEPGAPAAVATDYTPAVTKAEHLTPQLRGPENTPWWLQDIIKTTNAGINYAGIEKQMPWQATADTFLPDVLYKDPTRELAANSEQTNQAYNALAQFSGPQGLAANMSQIQGKALANSADINARYQNDNVGISNQASAQNAAILNDAAQRRAFGATSLYDKNTIADEQFRNSKVAARDALVNQYVSGITNKNYTANLNKMNPQFAVDTIHGGEYFFHNPKELDKRMQGEAPTITSITSKLMADNPYYREHPDKAYEHGMKILGYGVTPENPYLQDKGRSQIPNSYPDQKVG